MKQQAAFMAIIYTNKVPGGLSELAYRVYFDSISEEAAKALDDLGECWSLFAWDGEVYEYIGG